MATYELDEITLHDEQQSLAHHIKGDDEDLPPLIDADPTAMTSDQEANPPAVIDEWLKRKAWWPIGSKATWLDVQPNEKLKETGLGCVKRRHVLEFVDMPRFMSLLTTNPERNTEALLSLYNEAEQKMKTEAMSRHDRNSFAGTLCDSSE